MLFGIGPWDVALLLVVSTQATALAYLHDPRWKALLYAMPIPFTMGSLALGGTIGTSRILGLVLVLIYVNAVRWLHRGARVPIIMAIALCSLAYGAVAAAMVRVLPVHEMAFWIALAGMFVLAGAIYLRLPHKAEPGHRSPLPVPVKFIVVACVVMGLIALKRHLQGFMPVFPMVGVVAAYEARHSLWTFGRQVPAFIVAMVPMLAVCHLTQGHLGLAPALALGWAAFLPVLLLLTRRLWRPQASGQAAIDPSAG